MISPRPFLWWVPVVLVLLACSASSSLVSPVVREAPTASSTESAASAAEIVDAAPTVWTVCTDGLNVRSKPDATAPIVGGFVRGETVTVFESSAGWARVGVGQWVKAVYLCQ